MYKVPEIVIVSLL